MDKKRCLQFRPKHSSACPYKTTILIINTCKRIHWVESMKNLGCKNCPKWKKDRSSSGQNTRISLLEVLFLPYSVVIFSLSIFTNGWCSWEAHVRKTKRIDCHTMSLVNEKSLLATWMYECRWRTSHFDENQNWSDYTRRKIQQSIALLLSGIANRSHRLVRTTLRLSRACLIVARLSLRWENLNLI